MVNYRAKVVAGVGLLLLAFMAGCGGGNKELSNQERHQIASTLEGFVEAFGNADTTALATFWAQSCTVEQRATSNQGAMLVANLIGLGNKGTFDLAVDEPRLALEVGDNDHVTVPLEQPDGAVSAKLSLDAEVPGLGKVDGQGPMAKPLLVEVPLRFVDENGAWKVESCVLFVNEDEGEEDIPTATGSTP